MSIAPQPSEIASSQPSIDTASINTAPIRPQSAWRILLSKRLTVICLAIVILFVLAGLASFLPAVEQWTLKPVGDSYQPPRWGTPAVWLGTDILGRSVLWRVIYGTRVALIVTVGTGVLSLTIGTTLGLFAGYFGGWIDMVVTWLFTTITSVPWILLVVAIAYALGGYTFPDGTSIKDRYGDLPAIIAALGLTDWVGLCRLVRGEVLKIRSADYVQSARAAGFGTPRILLRHILPNTLHLVIISFCLSAVGYVQAEVALTFIGIGISAKPSWGRMITDAKLEVLRGVWWQLAAATICVFAISLSLNVVGDALRDALDPKLRGRH